MSIALHAEPARSIRRAPALRVLLSFACLYASFGATLGLIGGGAPLVFRAHGVALAQIGLIQAIYLPIGLTFLWAGHIDRIKLPGLPHRVGWIVAMQVATTVLLLALSRGTNWPIALLFILALATSVAAATMDIALEALVVETVPAEHRAAVTTAKLCGAAVGGMTGIGLITILPLSLPQALVVVAVLDVLWLLPILRYREGARDRTAVARQRTLACLRPVLGRAALLGAYFAASSMLGDSDSLVLLDLHVALPVVGVLTGPFARTIQIVMTLAAGALAMRFSADRLVLTLASGVALAGVLMLVATVATLPALGVAALVLNAIFGSALGVPVFAMIYRWAQGARAATDYALLFGAAFLAAMPARVGAPVFASALGWPLYFALCVPLYVAAFVALAYAMRTTRIADATRL